MSILYCSLIHNKQKRRIAESSCGKNFQMQIQSILPQISNGNVNDRLSLEDYYLTYTRSKEIIYLCVSPKRIGEERPRVFIEKLINKLNSNNFDIASEPMVTSNNMKELALQSKLQGPIDTFINNFNSGFEDSGLVVRELQKEVKETEKILKEAAAGQVDNLTRLKEGLLVTSENLKEGGNAFRKKAKNVEGDTRCCCKPWVIRLSISSGVILLLILIYIIVAFVRCDDINAFCDKENPPQPVNSTDIIIKSSYLLN